MIRTVIRFVLAIIAATVSSPALAAEMDRPVYCPAVEARFNGTHTKDADALYDATLIQDLQYCANRDPRVEAQIALVIDAKLFAIVARNDAVASHMVVAETHPLTRAHGDALLDWANDVLASVDVDALQPTGAFQARALHNFSHVRIEDGQPFSLGPPFMSFADAHAIASHGTIEERRQRLVDTLAYGKAKD